MSITAKIICDSISPQGIRITSFEVEFHRWILAEVNTHRVLSKNYRSSRAVPVAKLIQEVRENPAMPVKWLMNKPGMVATEPMSLDEMRWARAAWLRAAEYAAGSAECLLGDGLHKQWVNRLLEPFLFAHGVITATDWNNFFALRRAPDAQPEFEVLANAMHDAMQASIPELLRSGEWHLPYVLPTEIAEHGGLADPYGILRKFSTARVARVSVKPFDGENIDPVKDHKLHNQLFTMKHMSPFEHQATPDRCYNHDTYNERWGNKNQWGNFRSWCQYRKTLAGECVPG